MNALSQFEGKFRFANSIEIEILNENDALFLQLGGLDKKFKTPLIKQSNGKYRTGMKKSEIHFSPPRNGKSEILYFDGIPNYRPDPEDGPPAPFLFKPVIDLTPQKISDFEVLLENAHSSKGLIEYNLKYPKYELLQYLALEKNAIFHGSPNCVISEFQPLRKTLDSNIHGNVKATYATIDPIWPLFFAILDRDSFSFRIINGVEKFIFPDNSFQILYFFAIGKEFISPKIFTNGMIYIFDRSLFSISGGGEPEEAEWVCNKKVKSFLRLPIIPSDFPFISQIHPHQITKQQLYLQKLYPYIFQSNDELIELDDGIKLHYPWNDNQLLNISHYISLQKKFFTWMRFTVHIDPNEGIWLTLSGNPLIKSMVIDIMNKLKEN